jgi:glycosyltransferase involved in cell wall biosynthesis
MKIGIEAQRIFRKKKHGMDMVAIQLIKNLQIIDQVNQYFIFVNPSDDVSPIEASPNFTIVLLKRSPYPIWEQILLPQAVKKYGIDVLHCTSNTAPFSISVPLILTLHDIIYLEKIDWKSGTWYQLLGNLYRRWNVPRILKKAVKILTVSKYEEKRIRSYFQLGNNKIEVVYNGIGKHFKQLDQETAFSNKKLYKLPDHYALFLGNTDAKKNLGGLIKALKILYEQEKLSFDIVITDLSEDDLMSFLKEAKAESIRKKIFLSGYVPNSSLPVYYNNALFFLYVSLRESFGLPILEAMACGCPVITSNTSSMPEIAGGAALLVNPFNSEAIAEAMVSLLQNPALREKMIEMGVQRPSLFSYRSRVERILEMYGEVCREKG